MTIRILACLYCLATLFPAYAGAADNFHWNSEDYQLLSGDFDGDIKPDSVIVAKRPSLTSVLFSDDTQSAAAAIICL